MNTVVLFFPPVTSNYNQLLGSSIVPVLLGLSADFMNAREKEGGREREGANNGRNLAGSS